MCNITVDGECSSLWYGTGWGERYEVEQNNELESSFHPAPQRSSGFGILIKSTAIPCSFDYH